MARKYPLSSSALDTKPKMPWQKVPDTPGPDQPSKPLWPWLALLLVTGIFLLGGVSFCAANWLRSLPISLNTNTGQAARVQVTTLNVKRTVSYADLSLTVVNAQYATSFRDDLIRPAPAVVRLNMQVTNPTRGEISLVYYDIARLLVPAQQPIAPTNVELASAVSPGATVKGWIDFPLQWARSSRS